MNKTYTYQAMSDRKLAFHHAAWLNIAAVAVAAIPTCFVFGIWIDWRWLPTTIVAVFVAAISMLAVSFIIAEEERRKSADDG